MTTEGHQVDERIQMRRKDRAMPGDERIREFLTRAPVGMLATARRNQPFINSNLFVYDPSVHAIYIHTAAAGRTRDNIQQNPQVCFAVSEMGRLLPAKTALKFSVEYAGVVVFGRARVVEDPAEAERALQQLLDKYAPHLRPGKDYRPITAEELRVTSVIRIDIEAWSGKEKVVAEDFPGAYEYGQHG